MILINNLFLRYVRQYFALYDINLKIDDGERVGFVGESHSGKTSLLRILAKLEKATKGEVYVKDIPIKKVNYSVDISAGFIPSSPVFFENKTVYQNFVYILKSQKRPKTEIESEINRILIEFNLESIKDAKIFELSLFEKYVVSVARLCFREVKFVMIDDIFQNINDDQREQLVELIEKKFVQSGTTMIISAQNEKYIEKLCTRKVYFENGSITEDKKL